jgi:hypothetical protein
VKKLLFISTLLYALNARAQLPSSCYYTPSPDCGRVNQSMGVAVWLDGSEAYIFQTYCSSTGNVLCQHVERTCGQAMCTTWPGCPPGAYCVEAPRPSGCAPLCTARKRSVRHSKLQITSAPLDRARGARAARGPGVWPGAVARQGGQVGRSGQGVDGYISGASAGECQDNP